MERLYLYIPGEKQKDYYEEHGFEVRPKIDCIFECKYKPVREKCIFSKEIIKYKEIDWVVCNRKKSQIDEVSASQQNQVNRHFSFNNEYYNASNQYHKDIKRETNYSEVPPIKPKYDYPVVQSQNKPQPNNIPFSTLENSKTEVRPYFDFSIKGLSLREICNKIEVEESVTIEGCDVNAVEKIDVRSCNDGIVFFCKCNDRVYPYKVVAAWLENERLKYNIIANRKGKDYNNALELYNLALLSTIEVESIDQDNIRDRNKLGVF